MTILKHLKGTEVQTRAEVFSQLSIASAHFRRLKKQPSRREVTDQLISQVSVIARQVVGFYPQLFNDEQFATLCHEAILADLAPQSSVSRVITAFEFVWERYDELFGYGLTESSNVA